MGDIGPASTALLAIARDVGDDRALAGLICRACVEGLDVDGAALSLLTAQVARHSLHASDPTAELLEELQFSLGEGACIEAATTGRPVLVDDLGDRAQAARWPMFAAAALEQTSARAVFALPLRWGTANLGVIDLYRRVPEGLNDDQRKDALRAADTAALMMLTLHTDPAELGALTARGQSWLDPMLAARAEIHQATGMVLAQLNISADAALARMRAHAFVRGRLLIDVAHDVITRRLTFTQDMT